MASWRFGFHRLPQVVSVYRGRCPLPLYPLGPEGRNAAALWTPAHQGDSRSRTTPFDVTPAPLLGRWSGGWSCDYTRPPGPPVVVPLCGGRPFGPAPRRGRGRSGRVAVGKRDL